MANLIEDPTFTGSGDPAFWYGMWDDGGGAIKCYSPLLS
jgi:hypothetical protein